jgi:integrase
MEKSKVRPFVVYSLRHTFLTRLGESGCDSWTLARIAGHSSSKMSERYVHPGSDAVLAAFSRMPLQKAIADRVSDEPEEEGPEIEFSI